MLLVGANSVDDSIIRSSIHSKGSRCRSPLFILLCRMGDYDWAEATAYLDSAEVQRDAERIITLYEVWGFPDASATVSLANPRAGAVIVTFLIEEGRPITIHRLQVRGTDQIQGFRLPSRLPLKLGEPYALPRLQSTENLIYTELAQRGYPHAQIEVGGSVDQNARSADLVLEVKPGRRVVFGATSIETESPVAESVVRRRLAYRPGDPFSLDALERSERNLYALPITERATAEVNRTQRTDSMVDMLVTVAARGRHGFAGEALVSSTDCVEVRGFWQHRYILGGPRVFALGAHAANLLAAQASGEFPCTSTGEGVYARPDYGVDVDLRQFIGRSDMLIVSGYAARESAPGVYVQKGFGAQLSLARAFTNTLDVMLTLAPQRNQLTAADLYFCGQYGVCTATGIARLSEPNWRSPLEAVVLWTSSDVPTDVRRPDPGPGREWPARSIPTQRWNARAGFAAAGRFSGSDYDYRRALIEITSTRILGGRMEVAVRARAGIVSANNMVPPQVMLFSGGPNTVRGYAQNLLGPKVLATRTRPIGCDPCRSTLIVDPDVVTARPTGGDRLLEGNVEARLWLGSRIQLAAFVDAGRLERTAFDPIPARAEASITPGIGLRVISDIGPIRLDVGYDPAGAKRYPLFLQQDGNLLPLGNVTYDPFRFDRPGFIREALRRLQLQMSIGQAF